MDNRLRAWLAWLFWAAAGVDIVLTLIAGLNIIVTGGSGATTIYAILLLGVAGILGVFMLAFALVRNPVFRLVALVSVVWPLVQFGPTVATALFQPDVRPAPHDAFENPADGALADAIMAGDATKVAALAPAANLNAVGSGDVSFMQMALGRMPPYGPPKPDIVAALLKAGADPGQSSEYIFRVMTEGRDMDLLHAVAAAGVDMNQQTYTGQPQFFMLLDWPGALAVALRHGASTEAEDNTGKTAIMLVFAAGNWADVDLLLANGARIDHADHEGKSLRDAVRAVAERYRNNHQDVPPKLIALEANLK